MSERLALERIITRILLIVSITTVVLICVDAKHKENKKDDMISFNKGWVVQCNNENIDVTTLPNDIGNPKKAKIIMRNTIGQINDDNQVLMFFTVHQGVNVYIDNELRYKFYDSDNVRFGVHPGNKHNIVELQKADSGKDIKIVLTPSYSKSAGYCPEFYCGDLRSCVGDLLIRDWFNIFASLFMLVFGVVMILIHLIIKKFTQYKTTFLSMGLFIFFIGMWSFSESSIFNVYAINTANISMLTFSMLHLAGVPMFMFLKQIFSEKWGQAFEILSIITIAEYGVCLLLHITRVLDFSDTVVLAHCVYVLGVIIYAAAAIAARHTTKEQERGLLVHGVLFVVLGAAADGFMYYNSITYRNSTFTQLTLLMYAFVPVVVMIRELTQHISLGRQVGSYKKIAYTDSLTGLGNRAGFNYDMSIIPQSEYYKYSIINFDVNDLKVTNDKYGHECGDSLIITAAKAISEEFSAFGNCYRTGGDEFIAVLRRFDEKLYKKHMTKLRTYLDKVKLNEKVGITIASGFAEYRYDTDIDLYSTLNRADENMYEEKRRMKSGIVPEYVKEESKIKVTINPTELKAVLDEDAFADYAQLFNGESQTGDSEYDMEYRGNGNENGI